MTNNEKNFDLNYLLKLRLVIARYGEMDSARWWNTKGVLGNHGSIVYKRGLPKTHYFAQARVVFAVAKSRCIELFNNPNCITLWQLPAELEDQFNDKWHQWLDEVEQWIPFFENLTKINTGDQLIEILKRFELITVEQIESIVKLRRSAEGRAVPLLGSTKLDDNLIASLAAGFSKGEVGKPAIPYATFKGRI